MSHGKPCRYYLGEIVKQKPFIFCDNEIENIKYTRNKIIKSNSFQEKIEGYHDIIKNNITHIIQHENRIFSEEPTSEVKRWLP